MPNKNKNNSNNNNNKRVRRRRRKPKQRLTAIAPTMGESIGGYFGPLGARIGRGIGRFLGTVTGFGDYKINSNTLMQNQVPLFIGGLEKTVIRHREFIRDIVGTTTFNLSSLPLNPGMRTTFPWLASVARNYDQYRFRGLLFEFKTTSGTAVGSTNTALGTVIMATDYNASEASFPNKQAMEASQFACSSVPSMSLIHPIECAVTQTVLPLNYVRYAAPPEGDDLRLYDLGNFQIATSGMQTGVTTIGELWVSYDVELYKPVLEHDSLFSYAHLSESLTGTASAASPLGTTGGRYRSGTMEVTPITTTAFGLPQPGTYVIMVLCYGGTIAGNIGASFGSNLSDGPDIFFNDSISFARAFTSADALYCRTVRVNALGYTSANYVTIAGATGQSGGNTDVLIFEIPPNITVDRQFHGRYRMESFEDLKETKEVVKLHFR